MEIYRNNKIIQTWVNKKNTREMGLKWREMEGMKGIKTTKIWEGLTDMDKRIFWKEWTGRNKKKEWN